MNILDTKFKRPVKQNIKRILRSVASAQLSPVLNEMQSSSKNCQMLVQVVKSTLNENLSTSERQKLRKIEHLRTQLLQSKENVEIVDYGAGNPDSQRSTTEMQEGLTSTCSLSKIASASKPRFWALLLYNLVKTFEPKQIIELGSCVGISAAYQAVSQQQMPNKEGRFFTLEGSPVLAKKSAEHLKKLGLENAQVIEGRFDKTLPILLNSQSPIDMCFIDGHHDEKATLEYFSQILPFLSQQSVVVFDDIQWSEGMKTAWNQVRKHPSVSISLDLGAMGICIIDINEDMHSHYNLPFEGLLKKTVY